MAKAVALHKIERNVSLLTRIARAFGGNGQRVGSQLLVRDQCEI